ncbi:MAG: hypothetical protein WBE65_11600 [Steroidobacteraceae bacterium]
MPRVAGQQYEYLLRQLQDTREARRPNMQAQHPRLIASLSTDELAGLTTWHASAVHAVVAPARPRPPAECR